MADIVTREGALLACQAKDFAPFNNSAGERVEGGTTRHITIAGNDLSEQPIRIKVPAKYANLYNDLKYAGQFAVVEVQYSSWARGDRLEKVLEGARIVQSSLFPVADS